MTGLSSADESAILFLVIIVAIMIRRTYALSQGTPYSTARVFGYGAFSMVLFALFAASTIYVAVGSWGPIGYALVAPYIGVVIGSALIAEPRIRRLVKFEERAGGVLYYHLPIVVPVLNLVLFVVRLGIEIWLFGLSTITSFQFPTSLPIGALEILIAFDLLFGISIGLLIGRGLAVHRAFLARPHDTPLPTS